jgi:plasmid stability protein
MPSLTIDNITPELHRALKYLALKNGRGIEAEAFDILNSVAFAPSRLRLGSALAALGRSSGGFEIDVQRGMSPPRYAKFD